MSRFVRRVRATWRMWRVNQMGYKLRDLWAIAREKHPPRPCHEELTLRLADAAATLASAGVELSGDAGVVLTALDYALRGDPGCVEPEEWQEQRRQALAKHGDYLGLT